MKLKLSLLLMVFCVPSFAQFSGHVQMADQFAGATADVKINTCITAAIASASGVCDARGLGGTQTIAAQINVGDAGQDQVTLLLPSHATWNVTITNGTSCAIKQYGGTAMVGLNEAGNNTMTISPLNGSTSVAYWYCTDLAGGSYIRAEGFQIYNPGTVATTTGIGMYLYGTYDNSAWRDIVVADYIDTYEVKMVGLCCDTTFVNMTIAGPGYPGGAHANAVTPLFIDNGFDGNQITFFGSSIDHPGDGKPNVLINSSSSTLFSSVDLNGLYMESSAYDTTAPFISLTGTQGAQLQLNISGVRAAAIVASATKPILSSTTTGIASIYSRAVKAVGTFTLPLTAITDTPTGGSVISDASGNVKDYNNVGAAFAKLVSNGSTWTSTAGVPSANCAIGDMDTNKSASSASTVFYVCYPANTWTAVTAP